MKVPQILKRPVSVGLLPGLVVAGVLAASFLVRPVSLNGINLTSVCSYGYLGAPTVTGINPTSGPTVGGTTVIITGCGFTGATAVRFGATPAASKTVNSDSQITATSPVEAPGTVDVTVTAPSGTSAATLADQFTFGFISLGGSLTSGGGPSSCATGNVNVYVLGGDGVPWYKHWNGTTWSAWLLVGGNVMSNPSSVCNPGSMNTHIFTEGVDNHLYHRIWNGTTFAAWENLDGSLGSGPGSASCDGKVWAFVLNTAGTVYYKTFVSTWAGYIAIPSNVMGNPGAVCELNSPSHVDLFTEGVNNRLYHIAYNGTTWGAWEDLGGSLTSSPAAVSCVFGTLDVFVNGGDGVMWRKHWNGSVWGAWTKIGGNWTSDPGAVCQPGTTKIDVFARGGDSALWWEELPN